MASSPLIRLVLASQAGSLYTTAVSCATLVAVSVLGFSEVFGNHLGYSKFAGLAGSPNKAKLPSKLGMLVLYVPAVLPGVVSLVTLCPQRLGDARFLLLTSVVTLHFFKRVLEVLFIHKYSGEMGISSTILISLSYFSSASHLVYFNYKSSPSTQENHPLVIDLKYIGVVLFLLGIIGNFYHHILLSQLRKNGDKEKAYKIPKGGLFGLVICPHYLFEIITFLGISLISQTLFGYFFTVGTIFYLTGRSYATRKWYLSKFEDFPKHVKALFPYVF